MRKYISFSQLNLYARCGMAYYYRYGENLIAPPNPSLIAGKQYHASLEMNHKQKIDTALDLPLSVMNDHYANAVSEAFKEEVALSEEEKSLGKITMMDKTISKGQAALRVYHSDFAPNLQPLEIEKEFSINLGKDLMGNELPPLFGILDLVTVDMRVIDHKSSGRSPAKGDAENSLQLSAYALGFRELYGNFPEGMELQYAVVTDKGNAKSVVLKTQRTQDQIDRFLRRVSLWVDGIRKGVFVPPDQSSWACGYCNYRDAGICPL